MTIQEGGKQIRDMLRVMVHPNWDTDFVVRGSNMALLKLDKSAVQDGSVGLVCLPEAGQLLSHGAPRGNLYSKTLCSGLFVWREWDFNGNWTVSAILETH
ncbi:Chymotrypsin-like elastase family member 3B [Merluccius polli]|uniref:Chymotrypsin-like elastase family member 3B n=1 Tax=Merluccius polli TaxID=89951 RepID=A0AA47MKE9_MERPO|nr:Chymotrypsin-like elastase family member 3B [Merluccius polli]